MRYLVTGGGGFIGSNLTGKLLGAGHQVVVLDNFFTGREENLAPFKKNRNLAVHRLSITEDLTEIFSSGNFDCIFHLAGLPRIRFSIEYPIETHNANVNGTLNLLQSCRSFGVKRLIFSSSSSVYGEQKALPLREEMDTHPLNPYGFQKLTAEGYCRLYYELYGVETIILRYFNVYGPGMNPAGGYAQLIPKFIQQISQNIRPTINGDGTITRDFTYVDDVCEANILAATTNNKKCLGQIFNIGAGHGISVNDVATKIAKLAGNKVSPVYGPPLAEAHDTLADNSKAKKFLGWQAKISFDEGLKRTYNHLA